MALDRAAGDARGIRRVPRRRARRGARRDGDPACDDQSQARGRRLDPVPRAPPRARLRRDRLDVAPPVRLGHRSQRRGEAPHAPTCLRGLGLPAGRAEDRRAERALTRCDGGAGRALRGHPSQAHARPRRREPRQRLVLDRGRRVARGRASASEPRSRTDFSPPNACYTSRRPVSARNWSPGNDRERQRHRCARPRRSRRQRASRRARDRRARARRRARPALRPRPRDRRGRVRARARAVGRARERGNPARRRSSRIADGSRCIRCRPSRTTAGPSSSTVPGRRSPASHPRR